MRWRRCQAISLLPTLLWAISLTSSGAHPEKETAGVITEIKTGRGRVEVRPAGSVEWRHAQPLQVLRVGDLVRATEDGRFVVMLSGQPKSVAVGAADSPFLIPAPRAEKGQVQKLIELLQASLGFLSVRTEETPRVPLATRGPVPPEILTPRNGLVLPDRLIFEWLGSPSTPHTIRIVGQSGVLFERRRVTGAQLHYPPDAPRLSAGVRYTLQVLSTRYPVKEVWFEILHSDRAQAIQQDLAELERALSLKMSPNTLAVVKVGFLAGQGLLHDARYLLITALRKDPDEPTLHLLLGDLYVRLGLPDVAAESYDEARFLLTPRTKSPAPPR